MKTRFILPLTLVILVLTARGQICKSSWNNIEETITCFDNAIKDYEKSISQNPTNATAWNDKGYALYQQAEEDAMVYPGPYALAGIDQRKHMLWRENKRKEALRCFNKAIQLNPSLAAAWFNKGAMLWKMRSNDNDISYYKKVMNCFSKAHDLSGTPYQEILSPPLNSTDYWIPERYAEEDMLNNYFARK